MDLSSATLLSADSEYHPGLSGLRGLAVLWVLAAHYAHLQLLPFPTNYIGKAGVWIFFVLSAYLLTSGLKKTLQGTVCIWQPFLAFSIHRLFRIYPLFLCCLLYHYLRSDMPLSLLCQHLGLQAGWRELWAISVEFRYYLCIPALCFFVTRFSSNSVLSWLPLATLFICACVCMFWQPKEVFANSTALSAKLFPFACGSLLAVYQEKLLAGWRNSRWSALSSPVTMLALFALVLLTVNYRALSVSNLDVACSPLISLGLSFCAATLLFLALAAPLAQRFFSLPPLVFTGKISFSLYLWHWPVLSELTERGIGVAYFAYSIPITAFFLAVVSYRFIERPGIAVGRKLSSLFLR